MSSEFERNAILNVFSVKLSIFFKIGLLDHTSKGRRPEMEDGFVFVDQVCGGRGSNSD